MMKTSRLIGTAVIAAIVAVGCGKKDASDPNHIEDILALAKKSAEEDNNINFYGFYPGMSRYDAADLAAHYKLKEDECRASAWPGKAASILWFSLKGVRRLIGGGNTVEELAQAVANRVGDLEGRQGFWSRNTIDGVGVQFSSNGLVLWNDSSELKEPIVTKRNEQREANVQSEIIKDIIGNMVAIPGKNFKMGKYEVTQTQWQVVMGVNPSKFKHPDKPVEWVSWDDCKKFLEKLNAMPEVRASGLTFRLPAEAEWEYACRAGGTGDYCRLADGSEITRGTLSTVAWYQDNSGKQTTSVGRKMPNAFGLYDMLGNVWEWCEDSLYDGSRRVYRGSGWSHGSWLCKAGGRDDSAPDYRRSDIGFRLAASQD